MAIALMIGTFTGATTAFAELRTGHTDDVNESPPPLSGQAYVDLAQIRWSYDDATGAVAVAVRSYGPFSDNTGDWLSLSATSVVPSGVPSNGSCGYAANGTQEQSLSVYGALSRSGEATISRSGFGGSLPMARTFSTDRLEVTYTITDARLAGLALRCFSGALSYPAKPSCVNVYCTVTSSSGVSDRFDSPGYFAGHGPPVCDNGIDDDGDGLIDVKDRGCRGQATSSDETDPAQVASKLDLSLGRNGCSLKVRVSSGPQLVPSDLFPFSETRVTVRGSGVSKRETISANPGSRTFRRLAAGKYTVKARYLGDAFRSASQLVSRSISLPAKCARPRSVAM